MTKVILILLAGLVFEAVGVVNLSKGLRQAGGPGQSVIKFNGPGLLRLQRRVSMAANALAEKLVAILDGRP